VIAILSGPFFRRFAIKTFLRPLAGLAVVFLLAACGHSSPLNGSSLLNGGSEANAGDGSVIKVLSNRADLISGDDALIDVAPPAGVGGKSLTMVLNDRDVTAQFTQTSQGTLRGLVTGLVLGKNTFTAHLPGRDATATLINHPHGGPVFQGPQLQPWKCLNSAALDAQCNQPPEYSYWYKSTSPVNVGLQSYDPDNPPSDVADTTTDQGVTVPFIVRQELGYQDRDQYRIAVLFQPGKPWTAIEPQEQFNHKMLVGHGASCDVSYQSGDAPGVTSASVGGVPDGDNVVYALGQGFAVMSTALNNSGHNCTVTVQAESMMMAKERLIEQYGTLRYTIGTGCSGGSLTQQWVANAYPGIYQGILPTCSFPDAWTAATQVGDYALLENYFFDPTQWGTGVLWTPTQIADVEGNVTPLNAFVSVGCIQGPGGIARNCFSGYFIAAVPTHACPGISDAQRYDPQNNPGGVRCSIADLSLNLFGPRPPEVWSPAEQTVGHGFAGLPLDNVGIQYGLAVLQAGTITPAQFLDLNLKIGGADIDANPTAQRLKADQPALANAYRSGLINQANNLDRTAIIDCRGPDPGAAHDSFRAFAIRARLDREHGGHGNQLIWEGPVPLQADGFCALNSLIAMDRWLAAVEQDGSAKRLAQKLLDNKPADLGDACYDGVGNKVSDGLCPDAVVPVYGTARMVAGDAISTDTNKCQLKPLDRADNYGPLGFSDDQWAQLQALFPDGVCDFSKPGVSQQPTIPWQTYQDDAGAVIYGGTSLVPAPANSGEGWAAPAFNVFVQE